MKQHIIIIGLVIIFGAIAGFAESSDNFTITVTCNYIDFELKTADNSAEYTDWPVGNVNEGETVEMTTGAGGDHIYVENTSNVNLEFKAYSNSVAPGPCGYGTPVAWSPGGAAGLNTYYLRLGKGELGAVPGTYTDITGEDLGGAILYYSTIAGESYHLYTKLTAPNPADDGCSHTITVYIVAIAP